MRNAGSWRLSPLSTLLRLAVAGGAIAFLASCVTRPPPPVPMSSTEGSTLVRVGTVTDVRDYVVNGGGQNSRGGGLLGGLFGGLAGNQIGSGAGRGVATVAGAALGNLAGQQVGKPGPGKPVTQVTVRLADGETSTYDTSPADNFRVGETVKVVTAKGLTTVVR